MIKVTVSLQEVNVSQCNAFVWLWYVVKLQHVCQSRTKPVPFLFQSGLMLSVKL